MMNPKTQENDVGYIVQVLESALLFCLKKSYLKIGELLGFASQSIDYLPGTNRYQ